MSTLRALGLQTVAGLVVWLVVVAVALALDSTVLELPTVLLVLGQIVIVPLGLGLLHFRLGLGAALVRGARFLFRVGAVAVIVSLTLPRGELAAAVAALYLLPALMVGAASVIHAIGGLRDGATWQAPTLARIAAGGFLAVGALFYLLHRQGIAVGGFPDHIVQLTAIHFHFTGFGLMLMAGSLAPRAGAMGTASVLLLLGGMVVTPIGFIGSPALQAIGAILVAAALLIVAAGTLGVVRSLQTGSKRLLVVSCASALLAAGMAALYATGEALGSPPFSVEAMARVHGTVAAIGVVFCGLVAWRLAEER